jgi:acetyl/propionyl-CoA carboxylase alpha subunit
MQAFASDALILEMPLARSRHIEFQVFGDRHGNIIHLGERECSIQRRHQKVIEESPSPALTAELRRQMGDTAVAAARAINYSNAGTVEFLLAGDGNFYFLEMNTRLQVEHPVTEMVAGIDLVEWQIRVAEGEPLPLAQDEVKSKGHAIEARLYAEDPASQFLPASGRIQLWREPAGDGIRVESGIRAGDEISIHYDPMLAKIIAFGEQRDIAVRRLARALRATRLLGMANNLSFLYDLVSHPSFRAGEMSTEFVTDHFPAWQPPESDRPAMLLAIALACHLSTGKPNPAGYWRNNPNRRQRYRFQPAPEGEHLEMELVPVAGQDQVYEITFAGTNSNVKVAEYDGHHWNLEMDGYRRTFDIVHEGNTWWVQCGIASLTLQAVSLLPEPGPVAGARGSLRAPMPGSVLAVLVEVGQRVEKGQALMKLEAMKMEHTIRAAAAGVIEAIYYTPGDTVEADVSLLAITDL